MGDITDELERLHAHGETAQIFIGYKVALEKKCVELEQQLAVQTAKADGVSSYWEGFYKEQLTAAVVYCSCGDGIVAEDDAICGTCATVLEGNRDELIDALKAASARTAEARKLWEDEIHYMIRPDSDSKAENARDEKLLIAFEKLLGSELPAGEKQAGDLCTCGHHAGNHAAESFTTWGKCLICNKPGACDAYKQRGSGSPPKRADDIYDDLDEALRRSG
jgi:hypothetical protein